jgi:hypothetical protein
LLSVDEDSAGLWATYADPDTGAQLEREFLAAKPAPPSWGTAAGPWWALTPDRANVIVVAADRSVSKIPVLGGVGAATTLGRWWVPVSSVSVMPGFVRVYFICCIPGDSDLEQLIYLPTGISYTQWPSWRLQPAD